MKILLFTLLISNLYAQQITNIDESPKTECRVERENAITSTENDKIKFNSSKIIKIGDWMFEEGFYSKATTTLITEGYIIENPKQLQEIIDKDKDFFIFRTPKNFAAYKKRELESPHVMHYFINLSIDKQSVKVIVNKKVNVHNMVIGLLPPYEVEPKTKTISLNHKEVVNGITVECKNIKKLSKKEKKKVMKAVKRLAKNIDDSSRYSQKDLIKQVLESEKFNKAKRN